MNHPDDTQPPRWPLRLLRLFIKKEYLEEIEGDMEEIFHDNAERLSYTKAKRIYIWESLGLLRSSLLKKWKTIYPTNQSAMFKNYFTIGFRHVLRHKFFSAINVLCLAIGITFSLIIGVYVLNQYNINASLKNVNN